MAKKRILIVEDEIGVLKVTKLRLEHEGYDVITATDGKEALQRVVSEFPIHLVLLDIMLPRLNGYDVCRALKRQPSTAEIPVIVFTATEAQQQRLADRCIEVGVADWIKKPFDTKELLMKIRHALGEEDGFDE